MKIDKLSFSQKVTLKEDLVAYGYVSDEDIDNAIDFIEFVLTNWE